MAHNGECVSNAEYMLPMCPKTCTPEPFKFVNNCMAWEDEECSDRSCDYKAYQGYCDSDPDYMGPMCPVSCKTFDGYTENCQAFDDENCNDPFD